MHWANDDPAKLPRVSKATFDQTNSVTGKQERRSADEMGDP
jgi:hypothetical protein